MTVIKRQRSDNFAVIPNEVANDARLSFDARGLLVYLLAKPNDWYVSISDLMAQGQIGRDKTYRLLNELIEAGYVVRDREQDAETGRVKGFNYTIFDVAVQTSLPLPEKQDVEQPLPDLPDTGEPDTENQDTRKEELISNKIPPSPPQAGDQGFSDLRKAWPQDHWGNLDNAGGAFAKLSAEDQSSAVRNAAAAALAFTRRKARVPALAAYIRSRVFRDFDGGPEIDGSGSWRIKPDRPEWGPWLGWVRSKHGQRGVDSIVKCGFFLAPTRWPEGHELLRTAA